jgi:NitT/TauT family transport system substrate-binding protein
MARRAFTLFLAVTVTTLLVGSGCGSKDSNAKIAVEFNNHAASAYVAQFNGWFDEAGLEMLPIFQVYESGAAIASSLARGDIQIAYLGMTAAITAYARGVPIRIISGVHKYGYGLVASPEIESIFDLQGKTIGSLREGTVTDILLKLMIEKYELEDLTIQRLSPSNAVLALVSGGLNAAIIPEQHATVAEANGFPMLLTSQEIWPGMQGDVLVVTTGLIESNPDLVGELMAVTKRATEWVNAHQGETAVIMATQLQIAGGKLTSGGVTLTNPMDITPEIMARSMERVVYSISIDQFILQDTIDFMVEMGYIEEGIEAADILDLSFLAQA